MILENVVNIFRRKETLDHTPVVLGRNPGGKEDICIGAKNKFVSRDHCSLSTGIDKRVLITDISTNGTWVNGQPLSKRSIVIHDGDRISFDANNDTVVTIIFGNDGFIHLKVDDLGQRDYFKTAIPVPQLIEEHKKFPVKKSVDSIESPKNNEALSGREARIILELYRKKENGLPESELKRWLVEKYSDLDTDKLLAAAINKDGFREALVTTDFIDPVVVGNHTLQTGKKIFKTNADREYVPIILDGKFKVVYLSRSRRVFVELRATTPTNSTENWHVKSELESINDMPPEIDHALKKIAAHHEQVGYASLRPEQESTFFTNFGIRREDQVEASAEAAISLNIAKNQERIIELTDFPDLGNNPTEAFIDDNHSCIELTYFHTIDHQGKSVSVQLRVHIALNSQRTPIINVTPYHSHYLIAGIPEHKTFRPSSLRLSQEALDQFEGLDFSASRNTRLSRSSDFFDNFATTQVYAHAIQYLTGQTREYLPVNNETIKFL